jgi:hypothetical protein
LPNQRGSFHASVENGEYNAYENLKKMDKRDKMGVEAYHNDNKWYSCEAAAQLLTNFLIKLMLVRKAPHQHKYSYRPLQYQLPITCPEVRNNSRTWLHSFTVALEMAQLLHHSTQQTAKSLASSLSWATASLVLIMQYCMHIWGMKIIC